jgi:hypothetical protein
MCKRRAGGGGCRRWRADGGCDGLRRHGGCRRCGADGGWLAAARRRRGMRGLAAPRGMSPLTGRRLQKARPNRDRKGAARCSGPDGPTQTHRGGPRGQGGEGTVGGGRRCRAWWAWWVVGRGAAPSRSRFGRTGEGAARCSDPDGPAQTPTAAGPGGRAGRGRWVVGDGAAPGGSSEWCAAVPLPPGRGSDGLGVSVTAVAVTSRVAP